MNIEIAMEMIVLGRRMELLQLATSEYADQIFDHGSPKEIEQFQNDLMSELETSLIVTNSWKRCTRLMWKRANR